LTFGHKGQSILQRSEEGSDLPKGYWIANNHVHDADKYEEYKKLNAAAFEKYGAKFLIRAGQQQVTEGQAHPRSVVLEFPSYQAALDCYNSPEYSKALELQLGIADTTMIIVEGYDG